MSKGCYIPQFLPASFKGFSFEATSASSEHGRRGAEGEFPFGEDTAYADMGRRIRTYALQARFVTNDHVALANAFIAVCESQGPGDLVHPTRGIVTVACKKCAVKDELLEGYGITTVDLEFVEANDYLAGVGTNLFGMAIEPILAIAANILINGYDVASSPFFERSRVTDEASRTLTAINTEFKKCIGISPSDNVWAAVSKLVQASATQPTVYGTALLWSNISDGLAAIDRYAVDGKSKYAAFKAVSNAVARTSPFQLNTGRNLNALYTATRLAAVAYMVRTATQTPATTMDAGLARLDEIITVVDQEVEAVRLSCEAATYINMRQFRADTFNILSHQAYYLPATVIYQFNKQVSSMVAAYRIYGDAKRFADIEAQNAYRIPLTLGHFVTASKAA